MKFKATMVGLGLMGLILGSGTGCQSSAPPAPNIDPYAGNMPNITVDPALHQWLKVSGVNVQRDELMKVTVNVRLDYAGGADRYIQYKYTFLDSSGRPLASQTGWVNEAIPPRIERFLSGAALDSNAADWRLDIRLARGGN